MLIRQISTTTQGMYLEAGKGAPNNRHWMDA
jgi:hypothetical protein